MNRAVLLLVFVLAFLCDRIAAMKWKLCSDDGPFKPDSVVLSPDPPQIGQDISFDIQGAYEHGDSIPTGVLDVTVNFMGTPIFETEWDLCSKTQCPINPGKLDIHYGQTLPPIAPPGDYQVQLIAKDAGDAQLLCLLVDFQIAAPSWSSVLTSQD